MKFNTWVVAAGLVLGLSGSASAAGDGAISVGVARGLAEGMVNLRRAEAGLPPVMLDQRGAIGSLIGKVDANGNLSVIAAATGSAGDTRAITSLQGKVDTNNNLFVTLAGGTATPSAIVVAQGDTHNTPTQNAIATSATWSDGSIYSHWQINITDTGPSDTRSGLITAYGRAGGVTQLFQFTIDGGLSLAGVLIPTGIQSIATSTIGWNGRSKMASSADGKVEFKNAGATQTTTLTLPTGTTAVVPVVVALGRATAQTAANASVSTYTNTATDGTFEVSANVLVTTATTHAFTVTVAYTDEGSTARTLTLPFVLVAGSAIVNSVANANGAVPYMGIPLHIRAKASTAITIATTGTFTTVTYNVEGFIRKLS